MSSMLEGYYSIHQLKLLNAIIRLTFPNGFTAIVDTMTALCRGGRRRKARQNALEEIAVGITALIRRGFPPDYAMKLTPRQLAAYLEFNSRIDRIERADALMITAMGAQGDSKAIEKTLKQMTADNGAKVQSDG